jgi:hypothetical protein
MFRSSFRSSFAALVGLTCLASTAHADIVITEVDASGSASGNGYSVDWFELTNTDSSAASILNWRVDDGDPSAGSFPISNVSSLAPGESAIIFMETNSGNFASRKASFLSTWFGPSAPGSLQFGYVDGTNLGLSTSGDAVEIFTATSVHYSSVVFGASDANATFDNAILYSGSISTKSVVGVNGAFASYSATNNEIGSPGRIASPVPLPAGAWLLMSGLGALGAAARRRRSRTV